MELDTGGQAEVFRRGVDARWMDFVEGDTMGNFRWMLDPAQDRIIDGATSKWTSALVIVGVGPWSPEQFGSQRPQRCLWACVTWRCCLSGTSPLATAVPVGAGRCYQPGSAFWREYSHF